MPEKIDLRRSLPLEYFFRPTLRVARDLIWQYLVVKEGRALLAGRIVETEAYIGRRDPACHGARGKTPSNTVMFGPPGFGYVYFTYGNHFMLNFVTEKDDFPAAVLVRALEPMRGLTRMTKRRGVDDEQRLCKGPGNLTSALGIDRSFNGLPLVGDRLWVCPAVDSQPTISRSGRIGVNEGSDKPWRFFVKGHPCVSVYRQGTKAGRK